jgi:hypothetical protein
MATEHRVRGTVSSHRRGCVLWYPLFQRFERGIHDRTCTFTKANTLQKYVEVVGLRLTEDAKKRTEVHFVVVNHSGAEIADLAANVNLWARTAKSDEEAVGTFSFKIPSLGAYESKEMSGVLNTKLRVYELPDWQNLVAEMQITSPE